MTNMAGSRLPLGRQLIYQAVCLLILAIVLLPVLWILSMSLDPRDIARPTSFVPDGASLKAYQTVIEKPTPNPVSFWELARNSFLLATGVSAAAVIVGVTAAYAFSRFRFPVARSACSASSSC